MKRRRGLWVVGILVLGGLGFAARVRVLTAIGAYLVADEGRRSADAIVVVSGSVPDRMLEAVDLYHAGLAPRLVLTREGDLPGLAALRARGGDVPDRHDLNVSIAIQLGVPEEALVTADGVASSTRAEAQIVVAFLRRQGIRRALLVTSKLHSHRAGLIFRTVAAGSVDFTVCASRYDPVEPAAWWQHRAMVRSVIFEYQKLLLFQLWERWDAPLTSGDH